MTRLRVTLAPRSAARVVWAVSDRWAAFGERWRDRAAKRWSTLTRKLPRRAGQEG
ncbi:hypothetical protein G3I23_12990 [Streptomyces sp. SID10115]|nr:hypothetical protein [Streptomyces sp. SID10115]